jgi:hypothetical protein
MSIEYIYPQGGQDASIFTTLKDSNGNLVTGLTASELAAAYWRPLNAAATTVTLSDLAGADSSHTDGGVVEVDATNMPGLYRVDLPDAAIASGENFVIVTVDAGINTGRVYGIVSLDPQPNILDGKIVVDSGNNAGKFKTDLSEDTDDQYISTFVLFRTGANAGALRHVTGYDGSTKVVSVDTNFPTAPSGGDEFLIINR